LAAITDAVTAGPALVVVEGEPGMGKTRLVRRALDELPDETVLVCTSPPLPEPFPLGPVVDGLRRLCADQPPEGSASPASPSCALAFPGLPRLSPSGPRRRDPQVPLGLAIPIILRRPFPR
jgi:hypothetical protein